MFTAVNPQGCRVASFKVPTELEQRHDFLWRVHAQVPERGMMTVSATARLTQDDPIALLALPTFLDGFLSVAYVRIAIQFADRLSRCISLLCEDAKS